MYKVPYSLKCVKKECKVKRGREYYGCGEEYNIKKGGNNTIFPVMSREKGGYFGEEKNKGKL